MKKFAIIAILALSACSGGQDAAAPMPEETVAPEVAVSLAADGGPSTGTYEVTNSDGSVVTQVIAEGGTMTSTAADGTEKMGTWNQPSPDRFCTTKDGETEEHCYKEVVGADGVWSSADEADETDTSTIKRM